MPSDHSCREVARHLLPPLEELSTWVRHFSFPCLRNSIRLLPWESFCLFQPFFNPSSSKHATTITYKQPYTAHMTPQFSNVSLTKTCFHVRLPVQHHNPRVKPKYTGKPSTTPRKAQTAMTCNAVMRINNVKPCTALQSVARPAIRASRRAASLMNRAGGSVPRPRICAFAKSSQSWHRLNNHRRRRMYLLSGGRVRGSLWFQYVHISGCERIQAAKH